LATRGTAPPSSTIGQSDRRAERRGIEQLKLRIADLGSLIVGRLGRPPIAVATPALDRFKVFVVHGRDDEAKIEVARFLERMGLGSVTWLRSKPLPISAFP
jgi:hypothetical protein